MPVTIRKQGSGYEVRTPNGIKAKNTTKAKAASQEHLLNAIDHGWKPTGKPGYLARKQKRISKGR